MRPLMSTPSAAMLAAIVYGLTSDEAWNAQFNPEHPETRSGWAAVIGVVVALLVGACVLMATIAFSAQRYFEFEAETSVKLSARSADQPRSATTL